MYPAAIWKFINLIVLVAQSHNGLLFSHLHTLARPSVVLYLCLNLLKLTTNERPMKIEDTEARFMIGSYMISSNGKWKEYSKE